MSNTTDWLAAISALISAAGGAFAARAAFLSAKSARDAQRAADDAERRASLREIGLLASAVVVEEQRISNLTVQLKLGYQAIGVFSGSTGNSAIAQCIAQAEEKGQEAHVLAEGSRLFSDGARSLEQSSMGDIDRVHTRQAAAHKRAVAIREELEREQSSVEARNAESRVSRDRTRLAR